MTVNDFISKFASLSIVRIFDKWHSVSKMCAWDDIYSGGCLNNKDTFHNNPQFLLTVSHETPLIVYMQQKDY